MEINKLICCKEQQKNSKTLSNLFPINNREKIGKSKETYPL